MNEKIKPTDSFSENFGYCGKHEKRYRNDKEIVERQGVQHLTMQ